ncbi:MAG: 50S ribosomal protein L17 [Pseudobdellovibrionaceae bacterium]|jgi:large subunit ribosomal protein L17
MSRHNRRVKHFSRKPTARKALLRGLMVSLVEHGRITTTVDKAKEVRRHIEKAITVGKGGDLAARRLLLSRLASQTAVNTILTDISPRMASRNGGYTRIIKIGRRPGDQAEMAFLEFVDHNWEKSADTTEKSAGKKGEKAAEKKTAAKPKTKAGALAARKKIAAKKQQKKSRVAARA